MDFGLISDGGIGGNDVRECFPHARVCLGFDEFGKVERVSETSYVLERQ